MGIPCDYRQGLTQAYNCMPQNQQASFQGLAIQRLIVTANTCVTEISSSHIAFDHNPCTLLQGSLFQSSICCLVQHCAALQIHSF